MNAYHSIRIILRTIINASPSQNDLSHIFRDMRKDRWKRVAKQLKSPRGASLCALKDPSGLSILSVAVMSNPPLEILHLILQLNPAASLEQDDYGSIPLHLACLNGANSDVIRILLEHDNGISAAVPDDVDHRVPLHHAVEFAARLEKKQLTNQSGTDHHGPRSGGGAAGAVASSTTTSSSQKHRAGGIAPGVVSSRSSSNQFIASFSSSAFSSSPSSGREDVLIISLLCDAEPEMVHFRSKSGETPMDIAHVIKDWAESSQELKRIEKCYSILKTTAIRLYKKKRQEWENQGFDKVLNPGEKKWESFSYYETSTSPSTYSSSSVVAASHVSALASLDTSSSTMIASIPNPSHHPLPTTTNMHQHGPGSGYPVALLSQNGLS